MDQKISFSSLIKSIICAALLIVGSIFIIYYANIGQQNIKGSDIGRMWVVGKYVNHGVNPFKISVQLLEDAFGQIAGENRAKLKDFKLYSLSTALLYTAPPADFLPEYGAPEATYPPNAVPIFQLLTLFSSKADLIWYWAFVNALALVAVIYITRSWLFPRNFPLHLKLWAAAIIVCWPPVFSVFRSSQLSILAFLTLYGSWHYADKNKFISCLLLTLASIKPSLAIPFLCAFLLYRQRQVALITGVIHLMFIFLVSIQVNASPIDLVSQWLVTARYFLQGTYSIQEIINRLSIDNTPVGLALQLSVVLVGVLFSYRSFKKDSSEQALAILCFTSLLWVYHDTYDFVFLIYPLLLVSQSLLFSNSQSKLSWFFFILVIAIAIGASDAVWSSDFQLSRLFRWVGRLSMWTAFLVISTSEPIKSIKRQSEIRI